MMAAPAAPAAFADLLLEVEGDYAFGASLAEMTWFRVGGPADAVFKPKDEDDLARFLSGYPDDLPLTVIGVGSNLLVRDGGVAGVVVRLPKALGRIRVEGERVVAGGGAVDIAVASAARDAGLAGLEFLRGVPGTIGGAVAMNAGAYGREIADILVEVSLRLRDGSRVTLPASDLDLSYRHASLPEGAIVVEVVLEGRPGNRAAIAAEMDRIAQEREESQPLRTRTGGSTFKNPPGAKAWQLIDAAGCRGLKRGGAMVSPKHCNFLINTGEATAADLEDLGEEVRRRVKEKTGVTLEWEIRRVGRRGGAS